MELSAGAPVLDIGCGTGAGSRILGPTPTGSDGRRLGGWGSALGGPTLVIRLFGALDVRLGDEALPPLESGRAESLLAYLVLHQDAPQVRQHLAFLLWPDSTEAQARTNLRHVLHNLRRAAPALDGYLDVTPRTLRWRSEAPCWLDVAAFDAATARAERDTADGGLAALQEAVGLYRGDLLAGCYDEWLFGERERLLQRYLAAVARLAELLEGRGDRARAIAYAEQLLRHDPLREESYRLLMRLHDGSGDRARALRVYHACAATLERELGVGPSAATRETYEALLPPAHDGAAGGPAGRSVGPPFVGRAPERARLAALWRAAERGQPQLVLVAGEPGIGKTRLIEELRSWCAHRGALTAGARAYAAEGALAYGPVVAWLRSPALRQHIARLDGPQLTELARLLPELLTDVPGLTRPEPLPPDEQRQRLFDAVTRAIRASGAPLLLVADDVHWYDRETLQLLHYLLRVAPDARLLVAATARREELVPQHPLHDLLAGLRLLERCTEIELGRLTRDETAALAEQLGGQSLGVASVDQLYDETEGSPLFVVEALRAGWQPGQTGRAWLNPKVQAVIGARLAQLSASARDLVGVAATIGREFTSDVLARASETDETAFVRALDELWQRRLVREQGVDAYDFSHDTIREVAYLSLSPALRRHHHLRVAGALERAHAHDAGPVSGQLAAHYDRAGATDQAILWYERAADAALELHASPEVVRLLERALDLLRALPETPQRRARELALLTVLPAALAWVQGFQSARLAEVQRRALELTQALGIEPYPPLLRSLALASLSGNDFAGARRFGARLRARGARDADAMLVVEGEYVLGVVAFWLGELATARRHFESSIACFRPEERRAHLLRYAQDPEVICLNRLACTLWFLGYPDAAVRARDRSLALAEETGHPQTHSLALVFASLLSLEAHEPERLPAFVARFVAYGGGYDRWHIRTHGAVLAGYVDVLAGDAAAGIARIRHAIDDAPAVAPAPGHAAFHQRVLLAACEAAGDTGTGLAAAERLIAMGDAAGLWEAEARRMRAEFLAALGASEQEVEAELDRALRVARRQGARSLELRAATSLLGHRLRRGDGRRVRAARDPLTALLAGFGEGHDTRDLHRAAALLARS
jgi:DNA-binding SARP family transcriptional activator